MSIDLTKILLREKSNPNYMAKGSSLTWDEEDTNFILLGDAVRELQVPGDSGFSPYDNSKTYSNVLPDYVSYDGNIYEYIKAFPQSGVTPGSDPLTWQVASVGQFSHQQNTDQYVDFGGAYETSAQEIYTAVHSNSGDQIFRGTWVGSGSPQPTYLEGDVVLHSGGLYQAVNDNTNSEPGVTMDWLIQIVSEATYGPGWALNTAAATEGSVYEKIESLETDFDAIYERLDGLYEWTGDHDAGGFFLNGLAGLKIGVYGTVSETMAGLAYITGNSIIANPVNANEVIKTSNDPGHFMRMRYDRGVSFHTGLTGAIGTRFSDEDFERLLVDSNGDIQVITGDIIINDPSKGYVVSVRGGAPGALARIYVDSVLGVQSEPY